MKFASLFSGVGGFDLGFERAGMRCAWQCEIDKDARKVLANHWPDITCYEDVRNVGKGCEPVDLICGGFPCQDVSVAGKRAGLAGGRSGLWFEFARVIDELEPGWVVIENVPGLLSSNKGRDFAVIIQWLADRGYGVAWRVLDSQYFGVAQRRRRVFIVASFGTGSSAEVLFEREGMSRDSAPSRKAGEKVAYSLRANPSHSGDKGDGGINTTLVTGTLDRKSTSANRGSQANETEFIVTAYDIHQNDDGRKDRPDGGLYVKETDVSLTIQTSGQGKSKTLVMAHGQANAEITEDISPTLQLLHEQPIVNGVRRLTPTECERLQGFPDGWTGGQSDSARYRQMGNAVTVNVAEWIGRRISGLKVRIL